MNDSHKFSKPSNALILTRTTRPHFTGHNIPTNGSNQFVKPLNDLIHPYEYFNPLNSPIYPHTLLADCTGHNTSTNDSGHFSNPCNAPIYPWTIPTNSTCCNTPTNHLDKFINPLIVSSLISYPTEPLNTLTNAQILHFRAGQKVTGPNLPTNGFGRLTRSRNATIHP